MWYLLIIVIFTVFLIPSYSEVERICEQNRICAVPGDYLKYKAISEEEEQTILHEFGEFVNSDRIKVTTTTTYGGREIEKTTYSVDLKTGLTDEFPDEEFPFFDMTLVPIGEDKSVTDPQASVEEKSIIFNGIKRTIIVGKATEEQVSIEIAYDKNTGVLMYIKWDISGETDIGSFFSNSEKKLVETNIFTTNLSTTSAKKPIPEWIRNNAKWWSSDQIGDSDFISGIQFLIKEGVMSIPETTVKNDNASNEIPKWIKNNAEWWSQGVITDDDFIKGIQYLVSNGIIKI